MNDFDPYAEPKLDFEQTQSPPAPRLQGTPRPEEVKSRVELQDVDPHLTLSYNGSSSILSIERKRLDVVLETLKGVTEFSR